jgi:hypothetical protein
LTKYIWEDNARWCILNYIYMGVLSELDDPLERDIKRITNRWGGMNLFVSKSWDDWLMHIRWGLDQSEDHPPIWDFIQSYYRNLWITPRVVTSGRHTCGPGEVVIADSDSLVVNEGWTVVLLWRGSVARWTWTFVKSRTDTYINSTDWSDVLDISWLNGSSESALVQFMTCERVSQRLTINQEPEWEFSEETDSFLESPIEWLDLCSPQAQLYARILHTLDESVTVLDNIDPGTTTLNKPQIIIVPAILSKKLNLDVQVWPGFTVIVDSPEVRVTWEGGLIYDFTTGNTNIAWESRHIWTERKWITLDDQVREIINNLVEMTGNESIRERFKEIANIVFEHNWKILEQTTWWYIEEPAGGSQEAVPWSWEVESPTLLNGHSWALCEREVEAESLSASLERVLAPKPPQQPSLPIWKIEELERAQEMRLALSALGKLDLRQKTAPVGEKLLWQWELWWVPDRGQGTLKDPQERTTVTDDTSSISDRERWLADKRLFYRRLLSGEPEIPAKEGKPGRRAIPGVYWDLPEVVITQIIDQWIPLEVAYKDFSITRWWGRAVVEGIIRVYEDNIRRTEASEKWIPFVWHTLWELQVKYPQVFMYL